MGRSARQPRATKHSLGAAADQRAPPQEFESLNGQALNPTVYTDVASNYGFYPSNVTNGRTLNAPYASYVTRQPNGAIDQSAIGDVWGSQWYAQALGPVQVISLNKCVGAEEVAPPRAAFAVRLTARDFPPPVQLPAVCAGHRPVQLFRRRAVKSQPHPNAVARRDLPRAHIPRVTAPPARTALLG